MSASKMRLRDVVISRGRLSVTLRGLSGTGCPLVRAKLGVELTSGTHSVLGALPPMADERHDCVSPIEAASGLKSRHSLEVPQYPQW